MYMTGPGYKTAGIQKMTPIQKPVVYLGNRKKTHKGAIYPRLYGPCLTWIKPHLSKLRKGERST